MGGASVKTTVVTLQFGAPRDYFAVSRAALGRYCFFHGYDLVVAPGRDYVDGRDQRWCKVDAMLYAIQNGADRVFYLDADALPVRPVRPVSELDGLLGEAGVLLGEDSPGHANTGVMVVRATAADVLEHWRAVPDEHPETRRTWPVDELGFNDHTLPTFRSRIALTRGPGDGDLLRGSFVNHFCNGDSARKAAALKDLVATWPQ